MGKSLDQRILGLLLLGIGFFVPLSNAITNILWVLALIYLLALGNTSARFREINLPRSLILCYGFFLFLSLLSALRAGSVSELKHELLVGIFFVIALGAIRQNTAEAVAWAFACGMGLGGLLGILQVSLGAGGPWWVEAPRWTHDAPEWALRFLNTYEGRAVGTRGHPNTYGQAAAVGFPLLLSLTMSSTKGRVAAWGLAAIGALSIILSMSRTAWMVLILFSLAMILATQRRRFGIFLGILAFAVLATFLTTKLPGDRRASLSLFREKFLKPVDYERLAKWRVALEIIRKEPFLGAGPGKTREAYLSTLQSTFPPDIVEKSALMGDPHNLYLRMACERGLPALLFFLAFSYNLLRFLFSKARGSPVILGCALGLLAMFLCGATESVFTDDEMVQAFWFLTGLSVCSSRVEG